MIWRVPGHRQRRCPAGLLPSTWCYRSAGNVRQATLPAVQFPDLLPVVDVYRVLQYFPVKFPDCGYGWVVANTPVVICRQCRRLLYRRYSHALEYTGRYRLCQRILAEPVSCTGLLPGTPPLPAGALPNTGTPRPLVMFHVEHLGHRRSRCPAGLLPGTPPLPVSHYRPGRS